MVQVIDTAGKSYILCSLPPGDAKNTRLALIQYLFGGQSRAIQYLTDKVKVLKFSTKEAYFELDWRRQTNAVGFYMMFFIFVPLIVVFLILGILSPFMLIPAGVVALVAGPVITIVGVLYFRGLMMRRRVHVSMETRSVTLETYMVKQQKVTSSKTIPIEDVKDVSMRTRVQYSQYGTTASFTIRLQLENGRHERLITMDTYLSAHRFGMLLTMLIAKIKKNIHESAENADNVLTYDSITRPNEQKLADFADEAVNKYFSETRKQMQSDKGKPQDEQQFQPDKE